MNNSLLTLFLLLIAALTVSGCLQEPEVTSTHYRWGEVTSEETELISTVVVDSPNFVPIPLSDVKLDIYMNGIHMGEGNAGDTTISGKDELKLSSRIENERLRDWWPTHIRNEEQTEVKIKGDLVFGVMGYGLEVPVENNVSFNTSVLSKMSSKEVRMGFLGFDALMMKNMDFKWDTEEEDGDTAIIVTMDVRNNLPVEIPLRSIDYQMEMNGVKIAQGARPNHITIPASGQREITIEMTMDETKIPQWWVTHIQKGEKTAATIDMQLTLEMDGEEQTVELSDMEFSFSTNIAGSMS